MEQGKGRKTVNRYVGIIKQAFRHGSKFGWVDTQVFYALQAVDNLKAGRTTAPEYRNIAPVSVDVMEKTLPQLSSVVADMVKVQYHGGMRPQDARNMRACDIDQSRDVWRYIPYTHKTEHKGKTRIVFLGPKSQAILAPYLEAKADTPAAFLFSPKDAVQLQRIEKRKNRKSVGKNGQVQPSQQDRSKPDAIRTPGGQYSKNSYNRAVSRACEQAEVAPWTPNQLRHTKGTEVRKKYGLEAARIFLGHADGSVTAIYAEPDLEIAEKVAREIG